MEIGPTWSLCTSLNVFYVFCFWVWCLKIWVPQTVTKRGSIPLFGAPFKIEQTRDLAEACLWAIRGCTMRKRPRLGPRQKLSCRERSQPARRRGRRSAKKRKRHRRKETRKGAKNDEKKKRATTRRRGELETHDTSPTQTRGPPGPGRGSRERPKKESPELSCAPKTERKKERKKGRKKERKQESKGNTKKEKLGESLTNYIQ